MAQVRTATGEIAGCSGGKKRGLIHRWTPGGSVAVICTNHIHVQLACIVNFTEVSAASIVGHN